MNVLDLIGETPRGAALPACPSEVRTVLTCHRHGCIRITRAGNADLMQRQLTDWAWTPLHHLDPRAQAGASVQQVLAELDKRVRMVSSGLGPYHYRWPRRG